jgi:3D-(3,5/4)-trihydroxycyclohexane-1,2-dione acylhydrolase (decyclizing)
VGDAKATLQELAEILTPVGTNRDQWLSMAVALKKKCETLRSERKSLASDLPTYAQVVIAVNDVARAEDYVLTAAGGLPGELNNNWLAHSVASFDCEYGFSCMGYEISGAWGAAIAQNTMKNKKSSGRVIALTGDGSYMMLNSDIYSAVLHRHPFTLVVCDNGGFAVISRLQIGNGADSFRTMITENASAPRVDFFAHAQSMGAETFRVKTVAELSAKIVETQNSDGVVVIVMETAPATWTEGGAFWEVGVPKVSSKVEVKAALAKVQEAKKNQRIY